MAQPGLCLVISPLIALMKDQVENLRRKNITAFALHSGQSAKEVLHTLKVAADSNCKFLYVSPERLETRLFKEYLPALNISLVAVDEAHCISQWGYDFRPPYLRIAALREEIPDVTFLALTASATPAVQQDICDKLEFKKPAVFRQSFERPNLSYSVFNATSKINKLLEIVKNVEGTGIVYCRSRRKTREISDLMIMHGIKADYYHAGLISSERSSKQEAWIKNETRVIVCTNAFGMGIDKPDVRFVVHMDLPDCLENYYQEAGRAGRDGKKSYAVLLYQDQDIEGLRSSVPGKFPPLETIREVFQALMNDLQLPVGSGEGLYFDFNFGDFIRNFRLDSVSAVSSIKALEQEGILGYSDNVFIPSKIQFTTGRQGLEFFLSENKSIEPLIQTLLRTYPGIFDVFTNIQEKYIAGLLKTDVDTLVKQLDFLDKTSIIEYQPQKDTPQVYMLCDRMKAADLTINIQQQEQRKKLYIERMEKMIAFTSERSCRSRIIGEYFGDQQMKDCGICDNCLSRKRDNLKEDEFSMITRAIKELLKKSPQDPVMIYSNLPYIEKDKISEVLRFLQSENKIELTRMGEIKSIGP